jgi:putative DNA primase/helicase
VKTEEVLSRLKAVRRASNGWLARCPAHEDHSPSLSIRESNGKILLHCFAGCAVGAICEALKIKLGNLFSEPRGSRVAESQVLQDARRSVRASLSRNLPRSVRDQPVTVIYTETDYVDEAMARALALTVEGDFVQVALSEGKG